MGLDRQAVRAAAWWSVMLVALMEHQAADRWKVFMLNDWTSVMLVVMWFVVVGGPRREAGRWCRPEGGGGVEWAGTDRFY